jgi:hypothetical protein
LRSCSPCSVQPRSLLLEAWPGLRHPLSRQPARLSGALRAAVVVAVLHRAKYPVMAPWLHIGRTDCPRNPCRPHCLPEATRRTTKQDLSETPSKTPQRDHTPTRPTNETSTTMQAIKPDTTTKQAQQPVSTQEDPSTTPARPQQDPRNISTSQSGRQRKGAGLAWTQEVSCRPDRALRYRSHFGSRYTRGSAVMQALLYSLVRASPSPRCTPFGEA